MLKFDNEKFEKEVQKDKFKKYRMDYSFEIEKWAGFDLVTTPNGQNVLMTQTKFHRAGHKVNTK